MHKIKRILLAAVLVGLAGFLFAEEPRRFRLGPSLDEALTLPGDAVLRDEPNFRSSQKLWNEMRHTEEDLAVSTAAVGVKVSSETALAPKPPPGIINVNLPYESSLSVTGRKVIKVELKNTTITAEQARESGVAKNSQTFNMEQELQARIQGTVARKTTINVNFDDTKDNVRDFSVVYKGDPDEIVQEAAFGDIVLSLPSTEFVNYNKQLFGIRTALKYKRAGLLAIGSRTKGTTETKRFTGTTTRQTARIKDVAYIRNRYYDLTFSTSAPMSALLAGRSVLPINGTIPEAVYAEDTTGTNALAQLYNVVSPTAPATLMTLRMRQLSPGIDYTIDRIRGILIFTNVQSADLRIAVDYTLGDGSQTRLSSLVAPGAQAVIIKDRTPETPGVSQEIKRFYNIGARNIARDNSRGNFLFRVLDQKEENEVTPATPTDPKYPDNIEVNFEAGTFELKNLLNFSDVYATNVNPANALHVVFSVEYQAILRTYTLRPNIVLQSENVQVNGRKLTRDLDYFIDYDIGIITFFNEDTIRDSSVIEITYEFAPFGGQLGETLVGVRGTFDIASNAQMGGLSIDKWGAGSTVLYNFGSKPTGPPDIRSAPSSLLVTEADTSMKGFKVGDIPLKTDVAVEVARSVQNPNLFGKALVDSMEGIKQEDASPLTELSWFPAANPAVSGATTITDFRGQKVEESHLRWQDGDFQTSDPDDGSATQKGLQILYKLNTESSAQREQASLINVISASSRDFSKKTTLEVELDGAGINGTGVELQIDYGTFNEDADGDGRLDTEDVNEDGKLTLGEDDGWVFNGPNGEARFGADNTRLDSEDLTNDRVLTTIDQAATDQPLFLLSPSRGERDSNGNLIQDLSFTGRKLFQIPLNIAQRTENEKARFTGIKQVRITVRNSATAPGRDGSIVVTRLSMVGNTYELPTITPVANSSMTVRGINNKDDAGVYVSLIGNGDYNALYKGAEPDAESKEQALALVYDLAAGATATTQNRFSAPRDFSRYDTFKFFLRKPDGCTAGCGGRTFLQVGSDTEYQEASIDLTNVPSSNWLTVVITQRDTNSDGTPDTWESATPNVTITRVGSGAPNLSQVSQIKIGLENNTGGRIAHQVWYNEIHVADPHERTGSARNYVFSTLWDKWGDFGGNYRTVDRNWQTPTTAVTDQDNTQSNLYFNINRFSFLPMSFKSTREKTITPSAFRSNQNSLVSVLEEGRAEKVSNVATAKLLLPRLPQLGFTYTNDSLENTIQQRMENNRAVALDLNYQPRNANWNILKGGKLVFRPIPTSVVYLHTQRVIDVRYSDAEALSLRHLSTAPFSSTDLSQFSNEDEIRLAFRPWDSFTFNPVYKVKTDTEQRMFRDDEIVSAGVSALNNVRTPRSIAQTVSAAGNLKLLSWLDPRYNYSITGTETNGIPVLSNTTAYQLKTISRRSEGEISAGIEVRRLVPTSRLLRSMNLTNSYRVEAGDTYNDMPEGFSWRSKLWVGSPLIVGTSTGARRVDATDRRTLRNGLTWQPLSAFTFSGARLRPFNSLSLTNNFTRTTEKSQSAGTLKNVKSITLPDAILTMSDIEDLFLVRRVIDASRLVLKYRDLRSETALVSRDKTVNYGVEYNFQFLKKWDVATAYNASSARSDNLITRQLGSLTDTVGYSIQTRIPWRVWAFTPRYEHSQTDARDAVRATNDLKNDIYSLQIYGDISKPLGVRFGRKEIGFANRLTLNSTIKWDKKRSNINPSTNFLDTYSATLSGDYTLSQNFRVQLGGDVAIEKHNEEFKKLDRTTFGLNATLTIQF